MINETLRKEVMISEAYTTALFWNNPSTYTFYADEKLNSEMFLNPAWGFFFGLGRHMTKQGVQIFDDITVSKYVTELNKDKEYDFLGGYEAIKEVMDEVRYKEDNLEAFYQDIKKYRMLQNLYEYLGDKVLEPNGKYDYKKLPKETIYTYWNDKILKIGFDGDSKHDEHFLLKGLRESVQRWDKHPAVGLPFYKSNKFTKICTGWDFGNLYMFGGFGGSGKTSFTFRKVVLSCIVNKEKLLVIANEQGAEEFRKMLIVTAMGIVNKSFNRQRINEGNFTEEENARLEAAIQWVEEQCGGEGEDKLITFVFMENYTIEAAKNLIRFYANRGVHRVLVDTGKPSEGSPNMPRWERMTEDMKEYYKLARPDGGGLNLAIWINVQLADAALTSRFLNEMALGEAKKMKNEASVLFMMRSVWDDEYSDGAHPLRVTNVEYNPNSMHADDNGYVHNEIKLLRDKTYYLLFTAKNRRGQDNKTGQKVLVYEVNFNSNYWKEIGWTVVADDKKYRAA